MFGSECWTLTKRLEQQITTALLIVQVINTNKLRRFGHVMRSEEDSTLRVVMKIKMNGKRQRGRLRLRLLDNVDSHLKGKNTSLKEVLETKCFENRLDWGKRPTTITLVVCLEAVLSNKCWISSYTRLQLATLSFIMSKYLVESVSCPTYMVIWTRLTSDATASKQTI